MENKDEFKKTDEKLDKVMKDGRDKALKGDKEGYDDSRVKFNSRVTLKNKIFMRISDVDVEDAAWLKDWCDKHTDKKQFLGIKVLRVIMENLEPITKNVLTQLTSLTLRVDSIEAHINTPLIEDPGVILPKTQGSARPKR